MRRPTLQMAIAAGIGLPVGICAEDLSGNAAIVNLAQEQLITDPLAPDEGWWGGWVKMVFTLIPSNLSAFIVTPTEVARIILLDVCDKPVRLRNGFFEYLQFGIGLQPPSCAPQVCGHSAMQAFERDTVVTLNNFAGTPQFLRVFISNNADLGKRIVFQGPDNNGVTVLDTDPQTQAAILGETVFFAAPFVQSKHLFSSLAGIQKDPTNGPVTVFMVDPVAGTQVLLTSLEPNETTAQYRRYLINGLPCGCCTTPGGSITVTAQCKLDFIPVVSPNDNLIIQSIPALLEQVQSIRYSRMDSAQAPALEAKHHARALQLLNGQLDHFLGKINTAVAVSLFGSDKLKPMPV